MKETYLNSVLSCKMTTENHNCLIRNGINTVEKLANLTDYDISKLRYSPKVLELVELRDIAKHYVSINLESEN